MPHIMDVEARERLRRVISSNPPGMTRQTTAHQATAETERTPPPFTSLYPTACAQSVSAEGIGVIVLIGFSQLERAVSSPMVAEGLWGSTAPYIVRHRDPMISLTSLSIH